IPPLPDRHRSADARRRSRVLAGHPHLPTGAEHRAAGGRCAVTRLEGTTGPTRYVFGYGSLLHPDSLRRTLPEVDLDACIPAQAADLLRCFDVAFPNDRSQQDKAYYDTDGSRPSRVLLANLRPSPTAPANGAGAPVDADALDAAGER